MSIVEDMIRIFNLSFRDIIKNDLNCQGQLSDYLKQQQQKFHKNDFDS